MTIFPTEP
ncbi:hypothetical protein CP061683_0023A, partial [Chlamydia psittaci 06-1683]